MRKIFDYYTKKKISNVTFFANTVAKRISNRELAKKVKKHIASMELDEIKKEMRKIIGEQRADVLIKRYRLQEFMTEVTKLVPFNVIGQEVKLSMGTLCLMEHKMLENLAEYYSEICS